jgi:hypothetical protein
VFLKGTIFVDLNEWEKRDDVNQVLLARQFCDDSIPQDNIWHLYSNRDAVQKSKVMKITPKKYVPKEFSFLSFYFECIVIVSVRYTHAFQPNSIVRYSILRSFYVKKSGLGNSFQKAFKIHIRIKDQI